MTVLVAEDVRASTLGTVRTLRDRGQRVVEVCSILDAVRVLDEEDVLCATIDQRMPFGDVGDADATDEQVNDFARLVGERVPFIWLTANEVSRDRMEIPGCISVVMKAGDVTGNVIAHFTRVVPGFHADVHSDQVLLEITSASAQYQGLVVAWRPEPFPIRSDLLPAWLRFQVEQAAPRPVYVKARARLAALTPGQLDLCNYEMISGATVNDSAIWDD